jgi:hypothetical protein
MKHIVCSNPGMVKPKTYREQVIFDEMKPALLCCWIVIVLARIYDSSWVAMSLHPNTLS